MNTRSFFSVATICILSFVFFVCGCGGGGTSPTPTAASDQAAQNGSNPVPQISAVNPAAVHAGGADFTLTVTGSGFVTGSTVMCNNYSRSTTFVSGTQLTAVMPAADILQIHPVQITVVNPSPGGGPSNSVPVTVLDPLPVISSLSPPSVLIGAQGFTLSVNGTGFQATSIVQWNGISRVTTFVTPTQVRAAILDADLAGLGPRQVTVLNPGASGGVSNIANFNVYNPTPTLTSMSITRMYAGGALSAITVQGTDFLNGASILWNGNTDPATYVNSTTLQFTPTPTDTAQPGLAQITAVNPNSGGPSNALSMTLDASGPGFSPTCISMMMDAVSLQKDPAGVCGGVLAGPFTVTPDARYIAFRAGAIYIPGIWGWASGEYELFSRDTCAGAGAGCAPTNILAAPMPIEGYLSDEARYVAFSRNHDIMIHIPGYATAHLYDSCLNGPRGCTPYYIDISVRSDSTLGRGSVGPISADGRYVLFWSDDPLIDGIAVSGLFLRDTCINAPPGCLPSTQRVSLDAGGTALAIPVFWHDLDRVQYQAHMTPEARFIAFTGDPGTGFQAFVRDTCIGAAGGCIPSTAQVSLSDIGVPANDVSYAGGMSHDGRYVTFESDGTNLVVGDSNGARDVFVRDTCTGAVGPCSPTTLLLSAGAGGTAADAASSQPVIDFGGRFVAFTSLATNLDALSIDTNAANDVFIRDTCIGAPVGCIPATRRLSVNQNGAQGNSDSDWPVITSDGKALVFHSKASNLMPITAWGPVSYEVLQVQSPF